MWAWSEPSTIWHLAFSFYGTEKFVSFNDVGENPLFLSSEKTRATFEIEINFQDDDSFLTIITKHKNISPRDIKLQHRDVFLFQSHFKIKGFLEISPRFPSGIVVVVSSMHNIFLN